MDKKLRINKIVSKKISFCAVDQVERRRKPGLPPHFAPRSESQTKGVPMAQSVKPSAIGLIAIFAIFLITQAVAAVMPAMSQFIAYWGAKGVDQTTVALISTLPNIFLVIGMLIAGAVAGKKVSYKVLAITGSALFTVFGCLPALISDNFTIILVARALFGFGLAFSLLSATPLSRGCMMGTNVRNTSDMALFS